MPIDIAIFHRTILDAKRRAIELHQQVAAGQQRLAEQLAASQAAIERSLKILSAERQR